MEQARGLRAVVAAELAAYRPSTQATLVTIEEWMTRRMQLWHRLDTLTRPAAATPPQRGAQQA